jgi:hypothetical protein
MQRNITALAIAGLLGGLQSQSLAPLAALGRGARRAIDRIGNDKSHIRRSTTYHKPNGAGECARRRRQIECGMLTASNGLVRHG